MADYIRSTWIKGKYKVEEWSAFKKEQKTNNDVEAWHSSLNNSLEELKTFYDVVSVLYGKAQLIPVEVDCLETGQLLRPQKKEYLDRDEKVWELWIAFEQKEIDIQTLHTENVLLLT